MTQSLPTEMMGSRLTRKAEAESHGCSTGTFNMMNAYNAGEQRPGIVLNEGTTPGYAAHLQHQLHNTYPSKRVKTELHDASLNRGMPVVPETSSRKLPGPVSSVELSAADTVGDTVSRQNQVPTSAIQDVSSAHSDTRGGLRNGNRTLTTYANPNLDVLKTEDALRGESASSALPGEPPKQLNENKVRCPIQILRDFCSDLSDGEKREILEYQQVYFWGQGCQKLSGAPSPSRNDGYDTTAGDYRVIVGDHIAYRYEVLNALGKGSFGQVFRVKDHKTNEFVALKIIRNRKQFHKQGLVEVSVLETLRKNDPEGKRHVIHMKEHFYFRNHLCITFDVLSMNLYELIKQRKGPIPVEIIRSIALQLLYALHYLRKLRITHCDLKPENILLKTPTKSEIRLIDFGSSCCNNDNPYYYIQSRFYRAPEVILGVNYDHGIDMWSFGCILAEMYTGRPLFPGSNEHDQLRWIMGLYGTPPQSVLQRAKRRHKFFTPCGAHLPAPANSKAPAPGSMNLADVLSGADPLFLELIQGCLKYESSDRWNPAQAIQHPWLQQRVQKVPTQPSVTSHRPCNPTQPERLLRRQTTRISSPSALSLKPDFTQPEKGVSGVQPCTQHQVLEGNLPAPWKVSSFPTINGHPSVPPTSQGISLTRQLLNGLSPIRAFAYGRHSRLSLRHLWSFETAGSGATTHR